MHQKPIATVLGYRRVAASVTSVVVAGLGMAGVYVSPENSEALGVVVGGLFSTGLTLWSIYAPEPSKLSPVKTNHKD